MLQEIVVVVLVAVLDDEAEVEKERAKNRCRVFSRRHACRINVDRDACRLAIARDSQNRRSDLSFPLALGLEMQCEELNTCRCRE